MDCYYNDIHYVFSWYLLFFGEFNSIEKYSPYFLFCPYIPTLSAKQINSIFKQEQDITVIHTLTFKFPLATQGLLYLSNPISSFPSLAEMDLEYWVKITPQEGVPQKRKRITERLWIYQFTKYLLHVKYLRFFLYLGSFNTEQMSSGNSVLGQVSCTEQCIY